LRSKKMGGKMEIKLAFVTRGKSSDTNEIKVAGKEKNRAVRWIQ